MARGKFGAIGTDRAIEAARHGGRITGVVTNLVASGTQLIEEGNQARRHVEEGCSRGIPLTRWVVVDDNRDLLRLVGGLAQFYITTCLLGQTAQAIGNSTNLTTAHAAQNDWRNGSIHLRQGVDHRGLEWANTMLAPMILILDEEGRRDDIGNIEL